MRSDLSAALKARDRVVTSALRTVLAAFENAEAPPIEDVPDGVTEHPRLLMDDDDRRRILREEIADREDTASRFDAGGRSAEAAAVRAGTAVLRAYL